jgi:hypothetical protein
MGPGACKGFSVNSEELVDFNRERRRLREGASIGR